MREDHEVESLKKFHRDHPGAIDKLREVLDLMIKEDAGPTLPTAWGVLPGTGLPDDAIRDSEAGWKMTPEPPPSCIEFRAGDCIRDPGADPTWSDVIARLEAATAACKKLEHAIYMALHSGGDVRGGFIAKAFRAAKEAEDNLKAMPVPPRDHHIKASES